MSWDLIEALFLTALAVWNAWRQRGEGPEAPPANLDVDVRVDLRAGTASLRVRRSPQRPAADRHPLQRSLD